MITTTEDTSRTTIPRAARFAQVIYLIGLVVGLGSMVAGDPMKAAIVDVVVSVLFVVPAVALTRGRAWAWWTLSIFALMSIAELADGVHNYAWLSLVANLLGAGTFILLQDSSVRTFCEKPFKRTGGDIALIVIGVLVALAVVVDLVLSLSGFIQG